jgi:hypothetical protein
VRLFFDVKVADRQTGAERLVRVEAPDEASAMARVRSFGGLISDARLAEVQEDATAAAVAGTTPVVRQASRREFCVKLVQESGLGVIFFGQSSVRAEALESVLNKAASDGWSFEFLIRDNRRLLLLWTRESILVVLSREVPT